MYFFYLDDFDDLPDHADALQISPRPDNDLRLLPFAQQILSGFSGQLVALAVGCPEYPAATFDVAVLHHAVDCERTGGVLLHGGASSQ